MTAPTLIPTSTVQNLSTSATHAESTAIAGAETLATTTIRLCATQDVYYLISPGGTAATTANGSLLPAGVVEYVRVRGGWILSAIRVSADGSLNITTMAEITSPT